MAPNSQEGKTPSISAGSEVCAEGRPPLQNIDSDELAKHAKEGDLWISIEGKVYDVTEWLGKHPGGGNAILSFAGQDVTDAFLAFHPRTAWSLLPQFRIGTLTDYNVTPIQTDYRKLLTDLKKAGLYKNPVNVYGQYAAVMIPMFILCVLGVVFSQSLCVFSNMSAGMLHG